jgi:hypothetical protein
LNHIEVGLFARDNQFQVANRDGDTLSLREKSGIKSDVTKPRTTDYNPHYFAGPPVSSSIPTSAPISTMHSPGIESAVGTLWNSGNQERWKRALERYWDFVKPANLALEKEMDRLDAESVRAMNPSGWYTFLLEKYFRWKYTASNRYASTTKLLR